MRRIPAVMLMAACFILSAPTPTLAGKLSNEALRQRCVDTLLLYDRQGNYIGEFCQRQWRFSADMNHSGAVTISDVWLWAKWLYFYPGDGLLYFVIRKAPALAKFFEISSNSYGGVFSGLVSFLVWLSIVIGAKAGSVEEQKSESGQPLEPPEHVRR